MSEAIQHYPPKEGFPLSASGFWVSTSEIPYKGMFSINLVTPWPIVTSSVRQFLCEFRKSPWFLEVDLGSQKTKIEKKLAGIATGNKGPIPSPGHEFPAESVEKPRRSFNSRMSTWFVDQSSIVSGSVIQKRPKSKKNELGLQRGIKNLFLRPDTNFQQNRSRNQEGVSILECPLDLLINHRS